MMRIELCALQGSSQRLFIFYLFLYNDDDDANERGNEVKRTISTGGHFIPGKEFLGLFSGTNSRQVNSKFGGGGS
jgi:hypothetical protein